MTLAKKKLFFFSRKKEQCNLRLTVPQRTTTTTCKEVHCLLNRRRALHCSPDPGAVITIPIQREVLKIDP